MKNKIILTYKDLEGNFSEESVWAILLENGYYKIDNIPFFAPNIALNDIVSVEIEDGNFYYDDLIKPSGHSTIQIIFFKTEYSNEILDKLINFGCKWEGFKDKPYYAIDIPKENDYSLVLGYLKTKLEEKILDYKEACIG